MATSIQLSREAEERLDLLASETGRSKEFYLQELIERGLEEIEDYYLAAEVLERVRKGEEPVYTSAEVRKNLMLDLARSAISAQVPFGRYMTSVQR